MSFGLTDLPPVQAAANVRSWQRDSFARGILPVIGITGGRGKSTVLRMLDAILRRTHLRTATWTNLGVELRGRRQRAEISGWSLALSRIQASTLDLGIQELHWSTINAVGLPPAMYPVMAIANLTGHHDGTGTPPLPVDAMRASLRAAQAVHGSGVLVIGADDHGLADAAQATNALLLVTGLSKDVPLLRQHLDAGGSGAWVEHGELHLGSLDDHRVILRVEELPCSLGGAAVFQVSNALTAAAIAMAIGIDSTTITQSLRAFASTPDILPGSFNAYNVESYQVYVDRLAPSWHVRTVLRAVNPRQLRRQVTVVGNLDSIPQADVREVGRLLGRHRGAIVMHSNHDVRRMDDFRRGIASNEYPPVAIYLPTERRALNRALKTAWPDDVVLILTGDDPGPASRAIHRLLVPPPSV